MKTILFFIVGMLSYVATAAQTENKHMTFKGVPIDGTLKEFMAKMENAGFITIETNAEHGILKGRFAGYEECYIVVCAHSNSKLIYSVGVEIPTSDNWSLLETSYQHLKNMLTIKYGSPTECVETFTGYSSPRDNIYKLLRVKMDECTYKTTFLTPNGGVILSLGYEPALSECVILIFYVDTINTEAGIASNLDDL